MPTEDVITIDDTLLSKKTVRKYSRSIGVVFSGDFKQFLFSKVFDEITFFAVIFLFFIKLNLINKLIIIKY